MAPSNHPRARITLIAHLALACAGLADMLTMATGCALAPTQEPAATEQASIRIRFHEGMTPPEALSSSAPALGLLPLAPIERSDVTRILVDVTYADSGQPFALNFALDELPDGGWQGTLPLLPQGQQLRFAAEASDAAGTILFSGETITTLTIDNQNVEIPLAPAQDQQTFDMPQMYRVVYPSAIAAGQEVQIVFTIRGNPGETIDYALTSNDGSTPFSPAAGSVTLTGTVADFVTLYTAPEVTEATDLGHQVVITSADALSSVAIATDFVTTVMPRADFLDVVDSVRPSVRFNPVVKKLTANGTAIADTVELTAEVSDDGDPAALAFQWAFTPNSGTPAATFANSGAGNPARLQGYTVDHQGTITLEVTDADGGTTTLYYELVPNQFADAIDHDAADVLTQIVAGQGHTCVLIGEGPTGIGRVRCWGEAQTGQLGYGNAQDIGDALDRLPFAAGDVPLPEPAVQIVAGNNHTCARLQSGMVYCWGNNTYGQLGYGHTDHLGDGEPVTSFGYVTLGSPARTIAAGGGHTCAIMHQSGALRCWGRNDFGQLGHGHTNTIGDDENVFDAGDVALGVAVEDVALGDYHTCALLATGKVRCWGRNTHGQLGYADSQDRGDDEAIDTLADVALPHPVRKVAAGALHTCVHLDSGAMRCWGAGGNGQLGFGFLVSGTDAYQQYGSAFGDGGGETPLALADIAVAGTVTDIALGAYHTCALLSSGQLTCWGYGGDGRLGYGNTDNQGVPPASGVDLQGTSAYGIAAGAAHTCALRSNGTARCWGEGASGRLGRGLVSDVYSPAATGDIAIFEPTSPAAYYQSCSEHLLHNPGAADGTYIIDPDGEGGASPYEVYCNNSIAGGGWQLVSSRAMDTGALFADAVCLDPQGNCSGTIPAPQRAPNVAPDLLFATTDNAVWLRLTGLRPPGADALLDVITLQRGLTASSSCTYPHYCGPTLDPALSVHSHSANFTPRFTTLSSQFSGYGGLWFGQGGGSGYNHVVSMNYYPYCAPGGIHISSSQSGSLGNVVCGKPGALYFRY